jgi:Carbohydrate binding domain
VKGTEYGPYCHNYDNKHNKSIYVAIVLIHMSMIIPKMITMISMKSRNKNLGKVFSKDKAFIKFSYLIFILLMTYPIFTSSALADTNLALNPSFESGKTIPLNWEFVTQNGNTPVWDTRSHTGSKSVKISVSGTTNRISGYPQSDIITAQPLTSYVISVWGKTEKAGGSNTPAVRVVELDANKKSLGQINLPVFSKGTNAWTQKTLQFKTGSTTKYIYIYANIWNGYGTFWMDDVELSLKNTSLSTPAPTTPAPTPSSGKPELGVFNREAVASVDDPLMKWQIIASPSGVLSYPKSTGVSFNLWSDWSKSKSKWTDIGPTGFIQNRFNLANKYKDGYEYAPFLLHEEMFGPIALSTWAEPLNTWQLEGKATFNDVEVKLLKTWIIENKDQAWNQAWWNGLKAGSSDPLLREWEVYYTTNLYKAWNEYVHSLGKKSMVIGFLSPQNSNYDGDMKYQMPANDYVLKNYDAIVDYSYPTTSAKVSYSLNKIKYLKSKYTAPNGKLMWILTGTFSDWSWTWSEALAQSEFNAVAPYADAIITYPYTNMGSRTNPYPKYLLKFYKARYG